MQETCIQRHARWTLLSMPTPLIQDGDGGRYILQLREH